MAGTKATGSSSSGEGVRLVVFDFDQTLSVIHVFKALAGWNKDSATHVPKPFATTERGQVRRIAELNQSEPFSKRGGFAKAMFGGEARVDQVRQLLRALVARDIQLVICTKGLVGAVRKCLHDLDLLHYFCQVYGNVGDNYGETTYDKELSRARPSSSERQFLGSPDVSSWRSKDKLIAQLMLHAGLHRDQVVLVEDDPEEIRRANSVCRTIWVREASGINIRHCSALRDMVESRANRGEELPEDSISCIGASGRAPSGHRRLRRTPSCGGCSEGSSGRSGTSSAPSVAARALAAMSRGDEAEAAFRDFSCNGTDAESYILQETARLNLDDDRRLREECRLRRHKVVSPPKESPPKDLLPPAGRRRQSQGSSKSSRAPGYSSLMAAGANLLG
mmetsp:Transcript_145712/g.256962  ORF Transcript_145712/g.256962 Transcript_145712/m.256962 type:complete len:392 (-) Transcript_145712:69-1244(-)